MGLALSDAQITALLDYLALIAKWTKVAVDAGMPRDVK